jgi:hypothetical protein
MQINISAARNAETAVTAITTLLLKKKLPYTLISHMSGQ